MSDPSVADVKLHVNDAAAARIIEVYAKAPPYYAVYRTPTRVLVHYADDPDIAKAQRAALAPLNPLRGLVNGLLDGWGPARSIRFTRGVADALIVALEGDVAGAATILQDVKQKIIDERTSWARFLYLIVAVVTAAVLILLLTGADAAVFSKLIALPPEGRGIWLAGGAGSVGAFFSIATAMRSRTILTDLQWLDNAADAVLRILIGLIAASLLFCMLQAHLVNISLGMPDPKAGASQQWMFVIVVGFTAGFLERLVPDLLSKSTLVVATSSGGGSGGLDPAPSGATAPAASNRVAAVTAARSGPTAATTASAADDGEDADHLCDVGVSAQEITPDAHLPPATGGVAPT